MIGKITDQAEVVVVGAGPAGLMAACVAARAGRRVLVLERMEQPGLKLLASGGGRCNLTNTLDQERLAARYGAAHRFVKPALSTLPPQRLREWFAHRGVTTQADQDGLVYPTDHTSRSIQQALLHAVSQAGVKVQLKSTVTAVKKTDQGFAITTSTGRIEAGRLILATGGPGYPKLGGDTGGHVLAKVLGHTIRAPVPALVPLLTEESWTRQLPGVSLAAVEIAWRKMTSTGPLLFTHRGISGPAVLNISGALAEALLTSPTERIAIRLVASMTDEPWSNLLTTWHKTEGQRAVSSLLNERLPSAVIRAIAEQAGMPEATRAGQLKQETRRALVELLARCPVTISGTEGFGQAMVTRGGIALDEVQSRTLESKVCPGLYCAGETLDVDGPCGGFNLQWAFASGYLAGQSAAGGVAHG